MSGDLDTELEGRVDMRITQFEMTTVDKLKKQIQMVKDNSKQMQDDIEAMRLRNELEVEQQRQQQWQAAMEHLKQAREHAAQENEKVLEKMREVSKTNQAETTNEALTWLESQFSSLRGPPAKDDEQTRKEQEEKQKAIEDLQKQQELVNKKWQDLTGTIPKTNFNPEPGNWGTDTQMNQQVLMQQLRTSLAGKTDTEDPNKKLLRALITGHNKTQATGGTSTLKPELLTSLLNENSSPNTMAEWLASLNKQDEGESNITKCLNGADIDGGGKPQKVKSGILDRTTYNIQEKQVWPQQNPVQDWADEDVEFKQMRFEHLVAGETRTIETCTDPAQILGRLKLLRRMAYLRLRGYAWHMVRKMYAAILTSIETREYSWESNFDRFETILYCKKSTFEQRSQPEARNGPDKDGRTETSRKRYCRDYNRPEGCPKNSPHPAWFGAG